MDSKLIQIKTFIRYTLDTNEFIHPNPVFIIRLVSTWDNSNTTPDSAKIIIYLYILFSNELRRFLKKKTVVSNKI